MLVSNGEALELQTAGVSQDCQLSCLEYLKIRGHRIKDLCEKNKASRKGLVLGTGRKDES